MKLCEKIALLRRRNGWSQEQLAEWTGVSRQSVSRWEKGRSMPDADKIVRLSELFGVTADQLLRDDLDAPAPGRPSAGKPASESGPRRITELDSYDFIIRWQSESRRWALGWASVPASASVLFLALGFDSLLSPDMQGAFGFLGMIIAFAVLMLGLNELLCAWLGKRSMTLNGGEPCVVDADALAWTQSALNRYLLDTAPIANTAYALLICVFPAFIAPIALAPGPGDVWFGVALGVPLALISVAVGLMTRRARMRQGYQYLLGLACCEPSDER